MPKRVHFSRNTSPVLEQGAKVQARRVGDVELDGGLVRAVLVLQREQVGAVVLAAQFADHQADRALLAVRHVPEAAAGQDLLLAPEPLDAGHRVALHFARYHAHLACSFGKLYVQVFFMISFILKTWTKNSCFS